MTPSTAAAGIMIQIARGGCRRLDELRERRCRHDAVAAQRFGFSGIARVTDALVPSSSQRRAMFPPILPRPTRPSCTGPLQW